MPTMAASLDCVMPGFSPCLSSLLILQLLLLLLSILTTTLDTLLLVLPPVAAPDSDATLYNTGLLWQVHHLRYHGRRLFNRRHRLGQILLTFSR